MPEDAATPRSTAPAATPAVEDSELLRRYADEGSETAFAELVRRRIGLVYAVALRHTHGDRHRAEDATQAVFTDLARKAATLARRPVLAGWLYRSAQYAAAGLVRAEQRRQAREQQAHLMEDESAPHRTPADWDKVRPVLDEALNEIDERDRDAILLRFFDGRPFAEIGERLRLTENAARMRVERALDKLNAALARRGITSTAAAIGLALAHPIGTAAPAGLAATVTGTALAQTAAGIGAAGAGGWLATTMGMTKLQIGIATAVVAAGGAGLATQAKTNAELRREIAALRVEPHAITALHAANRRLASVAAEVELMRSDDADLTRLEQQVADAQRAVASRKGLADEARLARVRANEHAARAEIDRMNREGNALVKEYKALTARAKDSSLSDAERESASAAGKLKLEVIRAKQSEVKAFIASSREALSREAGDLAYQPLADLGKPIVRQPPAADARISLHLPKVDPHSALSAYEFYSGKKIARDPSIAQLRGAIDLEMQTATPAEVIQALQNALRDQMNIVLEPAPDGGLVARPGPPR